MNDRKIEIGKKPKSFKSPSPNEFISKLQILLMNCPKIISFSEDGREIIIHNHERFVNEILPEYFKDSQWRSFLRQMNLYGFEKICRDMKTHIFQNEIFYKGNEQNFHKIQRKNSYVNAQSQIKPKNESYDQQLLELMAIESISMGIPSNPKLFQFEYPSDDYKNSTSSTHSSFSGSPWSPLNKLPPFQQLTSFENFDQNLSLGKEKEKEERELNSVMHFMKRVLKYRKTMEIMLKKLKISFAEIIRGPGNQKTDKCHENFKEYFSEIDKVSFLFNRKIVDYIQLRNYTLRKYNTNKRLNLTQPLMPLIQEETSPSEPYPSLKPEIFYPAPFPLSMSFESYSYPSRVENEDIYESSNTNFHVFKEQPMNDNNKGENGNLMNGVVREQGHVGFGLI